MSVRRKPATRPSALKAHIQAVEMRLRHRRDSIGIASGQLAQTFRDKLISPPALVAASLVGAAMDRRQRPSRLRLLAILQTANAGLWRVLTARSGTSARPD